MAWLEGLVVSLAPGVERATQVGGGVVLCDRARGAYVELAAADVPLVDALDGRRSLAEVARGCAEGQGSPGLGRLVALVGDLAAAGLLRGDAEAMAAAGLPAPKGDGPRWVLPVPGLARLLGALLRPVRALGPAAAVAFAGLAGVGLAAAGWLAHAPLPRETALRGAPAGLILVCAYVALGLALGLRDLVRASTAVALGAGVRTAGLRLAWGLLAPFADARDGLRAGRRGRRFLDAAGLAGSIFGLGALLAAASAVDRAGWHAAALGLDLAALAAAVAGALALCPLLGGDAGRLVVDLAPVDALGPRLRSYLARGILSGLFDRDRARRGIAPSLAEERFFALAAVATGLWLVGVLALERLAMRALVGKVLLPIAVSPAVADALRVAAVAALVALVAAALFAIVLSLLPVPLWIVTGALRRRRVARPPLARDEARATAAELARLPLFARLSPEAKEALARATEVVRYARGQRMVAQGEAADAFFVLRRGRAEVLVEDATGYERRVAVLDAGDSFGEVALAQGGARTATVRAQEPLVCLRVGRAAFEEALAAQGLPKSEVTELLRETQFLARLPFFADFPPDALARLSLQLAPRLTAAGEVVVREGDPGDRFYVVLEGAAQVTRGGEPVATLGPGDCFGEVALLSRVPRTATVTTTTASHLLELSAADFQAAVEASFRFGEAVESLGARRS